MLLIVVVRGFSKTQGNILYGTMLDWTKQEPKWSPLENVEDDPLHAQPGKVDLKV